MIGEVIANTNVIRYLMAAMGILGVIAKLVNQVTLGIEKNRGGGRSGFKKEKPAG